MEYEIYPIDELYHHGVRGMKWGIRRYQNKDGSLTKAGKKRRAKLEGELDKLGGNKKSSDDNKPGESGKKSVSEMSNKELQEHTTRMILEKNYYDAQRNLISTQPQQVNKGKAMAEKFIKDNVLPAIGNTTKSYVENYLKKNIGLETKDELAEVKRAFEILDYKQKTDKLRNPDKYLTEEDKNKRQERQFKAEDRAATLEGYKDAADKAAKQRQAEESARKSAADESARVANNPKSEEYYNSVYRNKGVGETYSNGSSYNRGLVPVSNPVTTIATTTVNNGRSTVNSNKNTPVTDLSTSYRSAGKQRVDSIIDKSGNEIFSFDYDSFNDYRKDDD